MVGLYSARIINYIIYIIFNTSQHPKKTPIDVPIDDGSPTRTNFFIWPSIAKTPKVLEFFQGLGIASSPSPTYTQNRIEDKKCE